MRDIKFRVWDGKTMYYPTDKNDLMLLIGDSNFFQVQNHADYDIRTAKYKDLSVVDTFEDDLQLMQYTGLKDKNGKDIYESDICRGPNGKYWVIEWVDYSWCITNEIIPNGHMKFGGQETYTIDKWLSLPPTKKELEVIGNIYATPKLLNNATKVKD